MYGNYLFILRCGYLHNTQYFEPLPIVEDIYCNIDILLARIDGTENDLHLVLQFSQQWWIAMKTSIKVLTVRLNKCKYLVMETKSTYTSVHQRGKHFAKNVNQSKQSIILSSELRRILTGQYFYKGFSKDIGTWCYDVWGI